MSRFNFMLAERIRRSSRMTMAGVAMIACAAIVHFAALEPLQGRIAQLQHDLASAKKNAKKIADNPERRDIRSIDARFNEFYRYFPPKRSVPDSLRTIYRAADKQAVQLIEGDYKIVPVKGDKLLGYQISLPVRGTYAQIRKFILQVLNDVPTISLDELNFKREAIAEAEVEAKIKLTLYMRAE